ncbi:MAG: efflux RND transporter periplasmic adaptor subunit, partial [bacterium]
VNAARQLQRFQSLRARRLIAQSEVDTAATSAAVATANVEVARGNLEQARAALSHAETNLAYTDIRSPTDGIVIARSVDVGQTVAASLQAPTLFTIANDLSKMEVHTSVDEADVGNVWERQDVSFTVDAYPSRRFKGNVFQVRNAPTNVQNVVTYNAVVRIDNKDLVLKPGMTANVEFLVSRKDNVLRIPNMATRFKPPGEKNEAQELLRQERRAGGSRRRSPPAAGGSRSGEQKEGRWVKIYVLRNQEPRQIELRLGITDGSQTEVLDGDINETDQVIIAVSSGAGSQSASAVANPFQQTTRQSSFGRIQ